MRPEKLQVIVTHPLSIIAGAILLFLLIQIVVVPHGPASGSHPGNLATTSKLYI